MSCSYADGLSPYENKGKLGLKEIFDPDEVVAAKTKTLAEWMTNAKHVVFHTGAGISTSAGIPDFRGPNGVWTLEERGEKPSLNIEFNDALPTKTHMALLKLVDAGKIQYIISQNIDGLHLKSGLKRKYLAELHGNMFIEQCSKCRRQFVLKSATTSVGQKCLQHLCSSTKFNGRRCRGKTHDTILDWEHSLPDKDLELADYHSSVADLSICLGTTLQIVPSGNLPLHCKKQKLGKLVICNLQPTKHDKKADLVIHSFVDSIMARLLEHFDLKIPEYDPAIDPTRTEEIVEWTISEESVQEMKKVYRERFPLVKRKSDQSNGYTKLTKREKIASECQETKNSGNLIKHNNESVVVKQENIQIKFENTNSAGNLKKKSELIGVNELLEQSGKHNSNSELQSTTNTHVISDLKSENASFPDASAELIQNDNLGESDKNVPMDSNVNEI